MWRKFLGIVLIVLAILYILIALVSTYEKPSGARDFVVWLLIVLPAILILYVGIRLIIKAHKIKKSLFPRELKPSELLFDWELSGKEWQEFKDKNCSPEAIQKSSVLLSFGAALGAFLLFFVGLIDADDNIKLIILPLVSVITFFISYFFVRKSKQKIFGRVYNLDKGSLKSDGEYLDFCGTILTINVSGKRTTQCKVYKRYSYSTLFLSVTNFNQRLNMTTYEFLVPEKNRKEAEEIAKKLKYFIK